MVQPWVNQQHEIAKCETRRDLPSPFNHFQSLWRSPATRGSLPRVAIIYSPRQWQRWRWRIRDEGCSKPNLFQSWLRVAFLSAAVVYYNKFGLFGQTFDYSSAQVCAHVWSVNPTPTRMLKNYETIAYWSCLQWNCFQRSCFHWSCFDKRRPTMLITIGTVLGDDWVACLFIDSRGYFWLVV